MYEAECPRCGATAEVDYQEVTALGDTEPSYVPGLVRCPTAGCGTTCPMCHREVGDIHAAECAPIILGKVEDPTRVSKDDCRDWDHSGLRVQLKALATVPPEVKMRARRRRVWDEAKALADLAVAGRRGFTAEEQGRWDALNDDLDLLDQKIRITKTVQAAIR